jgi:hypothetical protein
VSATATATWDGAVSDYNCAVASARGDRHQFLFMPSAHQKSDKTLIADAFHYVKEQSSLSLGHSSKSAKAIAENYRAIYT